MTAKDPLSIPREAVPYDFRINTAGVVEPSILEEGDVDQHHGWISDEDWESFRDILVYVLDKDLKGFLFSVIRHALARIVDKRSGCHGVLQCALRATSDAFKD